MGIVVLIILIALFTGAFAFAWRMRPAHGMHEVTGHLELQFHPATLAPLPAPEPLWEPRTIPDVNPPVTELTGALSAIRHPCYKYAANLAAMSWQSHKTLQRNYDVLAFATVAQAHYRMKVRYA